MNQQDLRKQIDNKKRELESLGNELMGEVGGVSPLGEATPERSGLLSSELANRVRKLQKEIEELTVKLVSKE